MRLDVVAELAAHQRNLAPDDAPAHAALVALPPPRLALLVAPAWCASARASALAALAGELGGGDGPLAIVDLADPGAPLPVRLAGLWDQGIRMLWLHGARDQPGHARAVAHRWPGALHAAGDSLLDAVLDPAEPIRALAPGVVRVAPGVPAPASALVLAAVDDDGDPRRVRAQGPHVWPYAIDRARRLGAWAGVVPPAALWGTEAGAQVRARWDAHWRAHGHDVVCPAVLGIDHALEADLRGAPRAAAPRRARIVAVTGIDGSGKSTQAARIAGALCDRGARVRVLKLYRQGAFLELANLLGARTRRGAPLAAFRVSRIVKLVDSLRVYRDHLAPALADCDAVIMDRYVETHIAAAESQLGWDLTAHPALAPFPAADLRFWLALDPEIALARREARGEPPSADEHAVGLAGYAEAFARLARAAPGAAEVVLDATGGEDANACAIAERVHAIVEPRGDGTGSSMTPPRAAPRARGAQIATVHVGVDAARVALGAEVPALRAALARWSGAVGVPEAFWLEAYAAQLVLDAIATRPARAAIALWPGAVAAMPGNAELVMLDELERMLAPLVEVESYDPRPERHEPAFVALGATRAAARRLARAYLDQLERVATARGWLPAAID